MGRLEHKGEAKSTTEKKPKVAPASPTPLPSEEMVPLEDSPENIYNLLVQTIGSSISNRWGYISVPTTEEEFKELVENFHKQPFLVAPISLTPGAVPPTEEEVINRIRKSHRHFKEDDIIKDRDELNRYTKLAELIALDFYPQSREIGYQRMLNYFAEVYAKEIARLEKELDSMTGGREELDDRTRQEIEEKIRDLQARERGLAKLLEVRQSLLQDIKDYMKKRWDAVDMIFDDDFKEALKAIGDANIQGYDTVGIPEEVWRFRSELTQELLKFKKDMTALFNDPKGDGFKPYNEFEEKYKDDPRYQSIKQKLIQANNGFSQPYITFFAGAIVELEDRLKPVVEKYADRIVKWRDTLSEKYEALKEKNEYYGRINSVLGEALREEDPKSALERIAGDKSRTDKERETAMALLSYLSQVESAGRAKILTIDGREIEPPVAPEPDLGEEFSPHLVGAIKDIAGEYEQHKAIYGDGNFLKALRDIADFRHSRAVAGVGGERSELEVLGEQISVARKIGDAVQTLREKVSVPGNVSKIPSMDDSEAFSLNRTLKHRFIMGREMGREYDYYRFMTNLRAFYNLELMMEKLMKGELTEENVDAIMEEPEFGIGEYIRRKFGGSAFLEVEEAIKGIARGQYKGQDAVPYYLSPDEYVKSIRDYVATKRIRDMVQEEGVGRYFGQGLVNRFFTFALTPLGLKPYTANKKFETCVRQALYPDVSAMNYAPSHRLKACMETYQNDLHRLSGTHEGLAGAILNGNPLHFPLAPLGVYFAFLSIYMQLKAKMVEVDMVELDREIDRAVKEKLLSANSVKEMDRNVKDYFYNELGFRFSVVPRGKFPEEEKEIKALVLKDMISEDKSLAKEIKDMIELADRAGLVSGDAPYLKKLLEKSPSKWTKEDIGDVLKLMDKVERSYARMMRDGEVYKYSFGGLLSYEELKMLGKDRRGKGVPFVLKGNEAEEFEERMKEAGDRLRTKKRELKPTRRVSSPDVPALGMDDEIWEKAKERLMKQVMSHAPSERREKVDALLKAKEKVSELRDKVNEEYNARTYTVAGEDKVFVVTANPKKLGKKERQFLKEMGKRLSSTLSPEESRALRKEREEFFLRRLGLDRNSLIEMMDKGQIQNGMEYQHVFSRIMSMKEYDLFFGEDRTPEPRTERQKIEKQRKVAGWQPSM